ncbi:hypothetical protein E1A91_D10G134300v1 [Gossypium mustelinum]|uniref:Uncharacterized protein n=1 Tax=Gossypium mustelinum TaxID=34275 RepID=A0A5D2T7R3_GOSMU|nr:hypothetical protein E1A91_D10G134300v1 [Gossypium mustelinum]
MFCERCFTWYYFTEVELSSLLGCFEKLGLVDCIWRALKENGHGSHVSSSVRLKEELFLCWDKLANGWCKSNTDGSWFQDINCDFSISIRNYNIDLAELRRILYGIDLAD